MKYGCRPSKLFDISEDSMRGAIAISYYFIAYGITIVKDLLTNSKTIIA